MKAKTLRISGSIFVLVAASIIAFALFLSPGRPEPSPPDETQQLDLIKEVVGLAILLVAPWIAGRRWYGLPVFFGYGAFWSFLFGWGLFDPVTKHGFPGQVPRYAVPETLAFCYAGGTAVAFIGWLAHYQLQHFKKSSRCKHPPFVSG